MEELNIFQKIERVRHAIGGVLKKSKSGYGYNYTPEEEILFTVEKEMDKLHLTLYPEIVPGTMQITPFSYQKTKYDKAAKKTYTETVNDILGQADTVFVWVNNDNPQETIRVPFALVGQQSDASQCFGSGLTYMNRYFLLKFFNVSTTNDDPDALKAKQAKAEADAQAAILKDLIEQIDVLLADKMTDNNRDDIMGIVAKAINRKANGKPVVNYRTIKQIPVATGLLQNLNDYLTRKED